jgi:tRNA uridine 5-carboxymethylaminomethyl modification enzyme
LVDDPRWGAFQSKRDAIHAEQQRLKQQWLRPQSMSDTEAERVLGKPMRREHSLMDLLARPDVRYRELMTLEVVEDLQLPESVVEQVEIQAKYAGYIERQQQEIEKNRRHQEMKLPEGLDYSQVSGLSIEIQEKLSRQRPATLGMAGRISGVTPAALSLLRIHLKKRTLSSLKGEN